MTYRSLSIGLFIKNQSIVGVVSILMLAFAAAPTASAAQWEFLKQKEGIVVSARESKLGNLPVFRGVGQIRASIPEVLAVMQDAPGAKDWMHKCLENRPIEIQMFMTASCITEPIRRGQFGTAMLLFRPEAGSISPASAFSSR